MAKYLNILSDIVRITPTLFDIIRRRHLSCSIKKAFLKISQNSQENTSAEVTFLNKVASLMLVILFFIKKETPTQVFSWELCEFLRTAFFI